MVCAVPQAVPSFPVNGLHLYTVPEKSGTTQATWTYALELRWIHGERREIVGFWGVPYITYPVVPPILSPMGLMTDAPVQSSAVPKYGPLRFLYDRLRLNV